MAKEYPRKSISDQVVLFSRYINDSRTKEEVIAELEALKTYIERILRAGVYLEK